MADSSAMIGSFSALRTVDVLLKALEDAPTKAVGDTERADAEATSIAQTDRALANFMLMVIYKKMILIVMGCKLSLVYNDKR
mmetsp:Transcript_30160/g.46242  ORF Transcript_30160/g.46242 Transcript_30160/m.46242 type:complete len:82 (-) Transcript_30160:25-270(-)